MSPVHFPLSLFLFVRNVVINQGTFFCVVFFIIEESKSIKLTRFGLKRKLSKRVINFLVFYLILSQRLLMGANENLPFCF